MPPFAFSKNNAFSFLKRKKQEPFSLTPGLDKINATLGSSRPTGAFSSGPNQNFTPMRNTFTQPKQPQVQPNFLQGVQDRSQQQINLQNKATTGFVDRIRTAGQAGVDAFRNQIPALQGGFDRFKEGVRAGLGRSRTATTAAQDQARLTSGKALRQGAEGFRQVKGDITKKFANLGAVDSSAFQNQFINAGTKFAGQQQEILGARANEVNRLEGEFAQAEIDAEQLIDTESVKLQQQISLIQGSIAQGTVEYEQAIADAYNNAQQNIFDIQDKLATFENDIALARQEADLEGEGAGQSNKSQALGLVDFILREGNIPAIAGGFRPGNIGFLGIDKIGGGGDTQAAWNSIKDLLALAARGQLKGSGTISDFEAEMLQKAAVAGLDPTKQTEEEFERGLRQLQSDLQAGGAVSSGGQIIRVRNLQTGETGSLPAEEFDPRLYERI